MKIIPRTLFSGTTEQLIARVQAFIDARIAHAATVGLPAPREEDFVEELADSQESYEVEPEPAVVPPPTAEELAAVAIETARRETFRAAINSDSVISQLKAMSSAEFDTWWDANVTTAAQAIQILKRLARVVVMRLL